MYESLRVQECVSMQLSIESHCYTHRHLRSPRKRLLIRRLGNHVERSAKWASYEKSFLTLTFAIAKANKFHTAMCAEVVLIL